MRKDAAATRAAVEAAFAEHGHNLSAIARATGVHRRTVQRHLQGMGVYGERPLVEGRVGVRPTVRRARPRAGVRRYLVTCATNNTLLHDPLWENLQVLAKLWGAEILVSRLAYNTNAYRGRVKPGTARRKEAPWYDERLEPHVCDERVELAPGLVFCGEMNISPTAARPLSGLETYTGRKSGIFPHPKVALESVPAMKGEGAKLNYTTGAVTLRNYLQRKAGQKAEFHHTYGALVVEVDSKGRWWVRQLSAEEDTGRIQDLRTVVDGGKVTEDDVEAIAYEPHGVEIAAGPRAVLPTILDTLRPRFQVLHDFLTFRARNHHEMKDPHREYQKRVSGEAYVEGEILETAEFLREIERPYCQTVAAAGNHDAFFRRWLREADYRKDPDNATYFLRAQLAVYEAYDRDEVLHVPAWAMRRAGAPEGVRYLEEDESFRVADGQVEMGNHGHLGPDGARGSSANLSRLARRMVVGHSHRAGIRDGVYTCGTFSELDLPYTRGPSSWSHSLVVVYPSGKRAILTLWDGRPWAG